MEYKPSFIEQLDADYICHYGVKGMKWGVRRQLGRRLEAKKLQFKLNMADRKYAQNKVDNDYQRKDVLNRIAKKSKKPNKNKWDEIVLENDKKWLSSPHTSQKSLRNSYKKRVDSIIRNAEKQGMHVSKRKGKRFVEKRLLKNNKTDALFYTTVPGNSIVRLRRVPGTKYKVHA